MTPLGLQRLEVQWEAAAAGLGRQPSVTPPTKLLGAAPETNKQTNRKKKIDRFEISTVFLNFRQRRQKERKRKKKVAWWQAAFRRGDCKWPPMPNEHLSRLPELKTADFFFF